MLGVPPPCGAGLLRCASSHRPVRPSSRPIRAAIPHAAHDQAGVAGADDNIGPCPCPGIAGPFSFTLRVNEACLPT
jgi:hypothetical protein